MLPPAILDNRGSTELVVAGACQWGGRAGAEEMDMSVSEKAGLLSLLFESDRELVNIKFFPGSKRGLTPGQLSAEAQRVLEDVLSRPLVDNPPMSGRVKASLKVAFSAM